MAEEFNNWGEYTPQEDVTSKGNNWKFGLNQNVRLKSFEYHEAIEKDGKTTSPKILAMFGNEEDTDEKSFKKLYIWEPDENKIYFDGKLTEKGTDEWKKGMEKQLKTAKRTVFDIIECFIGIDKIKSLLSTQKPKSFKEFATLMVKVVEKYNNNTPIDLFLQYATKLYEGKTVLEIPNANMGHFVTKHYEGDYREDVKIGEHLRYYLYENDVKTDKMHPIIRGSFKYWWDNNFKKVEIKSKDDFVNELNDVKTTGSESTVSWDDIDNL